MNRPQTIVVLGMTADGKITDKASSPARFGSQADKLHLEKQISLSDGVIFGAGTLRSYGTTLPITNPKLLQARKNRSQPPQPFQIVCSASGKLNPQLRFFSQPIPRWLLTTPAGAKIWQGKTAFERILVSGSDDEKSSEFGVRPTGSVLCSSRGTRPPQVPQSSEFGYLSSNEGKTQPMVWIKILAQMKQLGIDKLAILGGGKLVASLLEVDAVDEFYLTICPFIFGGKSASTPVEGKGWLQEQGRKLKLVSVKQIEQEVFLHYKTR